VADFASSCASALFSASSMFSAVLVRLSFISSESAPDGRGDDIPWSYRPIFADSTHWHFAFVTWVFWK
jgi:hypothetical protein